jgi:hypothetical protein
MWTTAPALRLYTAVAPRCRSTSGTRAPDTIRSARASRVLAREIEYQADEGIFSRVL